MAISEVLERFAEGSPVSVMFRATLEKIFSAEALDRIFQETARQQYQHELLFSTCVDLLALTVTRTYRSVNAAYVHKKAEVGVSVQSVYNKLKSIEPEVNRQLVRQTAAQLGQLLDALHAPRETPLPGYDVRITDGNHLAGTQHRVEALRGSRAAALPGQAIAVLDPQRGLLEEVLLCEDGHANQRPLFRQLLPLVQPGQCWIADRDFSTLSYLFGIRQRQAYFLVRQHAQLQGTLLGERRPLGRIATGTVFEQRLLLVDSEGHRLQARRITVELDQPTRDGETVLHLLTNLPARVPGRKVADAYRQRWTIEVAFQHLAVSLRGEVETLGYPDAALFAFAIALMLCNLLTVVQAAIRVAHAKPLERSGRRVSLYALAEEVAGIYRGMMVAIPAKHWEAEYAALSSRDLTDRLLALAQKVDLGQYLTYPQRPKRPPPKRKSGGRGNHVSTQRLLSQRKPHDVSTHHL